MSLKPCPRELVACDLRARKQPGAAARRASGASGGHLSGKGTSRTLAKSHSFTLHTHK